MARIKINYGHDVHSIEVTPDALAKIRAGTKVELEGQGFGHEEYEACADHWVFNGKPGEVFFYLDGGAEFWAQGAWADDDPLFPAKPRQSAG